MATQYTTVLKLALPTQGELSGTWGDVVNNNITSMVEEAIAGRAVINTWVANGHTLTTANGTTSESRCAMLEFTDTGTALTGAGEVICPAQPKIYLCKNDSGQAITVKTSGGTGIAVQDGEAKFVFCDGTNVVEAVTSMTTLKVGTGVQVNTILDEDNMASDSATALATQQSIKAYVDSQVTAQDLDFAGDSGTGAVDLDSQSLTVAGTANEIETSASGQTLTVGLPAAIIVTTSVTTPTIQVTNINANDGTAAATIADTTGVVTIPSSVLTTADINGGTIDNTTIGGTTPAAGTFTTVDTTGNITSQGQVITDTINEQTATSGVTVDSVLLKDGGITLATGVAVNAILDEDNMATDSDTALATQQSIKAYVDAQIGANNDLSEVLANGNTTGGNDIKFADNDKAIFGAGQDLQIYHDGSNSILNDDGDGNIQLQTGGSTKLAVIATGVTITGDIGADTATISGDLTVDTNTLYVDSTNNRVGVNTSSPATALDVTGTITADGLTVDGGATINGAAVISGQLRFNDTNYWIDNSGGSDISYRSGGTHQFYSGGFVQRLNIASNGDISFYEDTGTTPKMVWKSAEERLGIGTSSPQTKMHIQSSAVSGATYRATAPLAIENNGDCELQIIATGSSQVRFGDGATNFAGAVSYSHSVDSMIFFANSAEAMRITSGGSVGIGTSSPASTLHIAPSAGNTVVRIQSTGVPSVEFVNGAGTQRIRGGVGGANVLIFDTDSAERMRITSAGNVGIGTSSPSTQLEISETTNPTITLRRSGSTSGNGFLRSVGNTGSVNAQIELGGGIDNRMTFSTAGSERLRITSTGNVGIGTSSPESTPSTRLHIREDDSTDYKARTVIQATDQRLVLGSYWQSGVGQYSYVQATNDAESGAQPLLLNPDGGNVGIGTTSPSAKLDVNGTIRGSGVTISNGAADGGELTLESQGFNSWFIDNNSGNLRTIYNGNVPYQVDGPNNLHVWRSTASTAESMRINSSGYLGIGTTNPLRTLQVDNTGADFAAAASFVDNGAASSWARVDLTHQLGGGALAIFQNQAGQSGLQNTSTSATANLFFVAGANSNPSEIIFSNEVASEAMRISSSGNVGIGTTSTPYALTVSGTVGADYFRPTSNQTDPNDGSAYIYQLSGVGWDFAALNLRFSTGGSGARSEAMRIDSSGNVLVGTTTANGQGGFTINPSGSNGAAQTVFNRANTTASSFPVIFQNNSTAVGNISYNNTTTTYATSSDYRLKEDVQPMSGASDRLMQLNPVNFAWKADGTRTDGFLAHEAQAVVPQAVTGEKDAVDADGNPEYQGIDQSKLVPLLTAALQEAMTEIADLKARVAQLEA